MPVSTPRDAVQDGEPTTPATTVAGIVAHLAARFTGGDRAAVEHIETHLSHVFLCGQFVFKLLKPVRFAFVDFSTALRRREECLAEVALNRPLAGDVYLSAEPVWRLADGSIRIGPGETPEPAPQDGGSRGSPAEIVDWAVEMRRLPADRTLEALVERGEATGEQMRDLAAVLAAFYASAKRPSLPRDEYVSAVAHHVRDNLAELARGEHGMTPCLVWRVHAAQLTTLATQVVPFHERVAQGRIVEGHGDLRPEHVYFVPRPTVIDCLAFSRDLRTLDAADEVAFLAMELERIGAGGLAATFTSEYERITGDHPAAELWDFYRAYRACVRAKVAVLRAQQLDEPQRSAERSAARAYLDLADRGSRRLQRPLCIVVRGLSGTGKSTLAAALAERLGAKHLQTDHVRKQLFPSASPTGYGRGCYTTAARTMVYDAMLAQAREVLVERIPVVLDGTFLLARTRTKAAEIAARAGAAVVMLVCGCPLEVAAQRIADRAEAGRSESDAREATLRRQASEEEPDGRSIASTVIDTTTPLEQQLDAAIAAVRAAIAPP